MKPGMTVRAKYGRVNPDTKQEYLGRTLDVCDPIAWHGTLAFGVKLPTREQVQAHIARITELGCDMSGDVPVCWGFPGGNVVYWERAASLELVA